MQDKSQQSNSNEEKKLRMALKGIQTNDHCILTLRQENKNMADEITKWSILLAWKKSQCASVWFFYIRFRKEKTFAFIPTWIGKWRQLDSFVSVAILLYILSLSSLLDKFVTFCFIAWTFCFTNLCCVVATNTMWALPSSQNTLCLHRLGPLIDQKRRMHSIMLTCKSIIGNALTPYNSSGSKCSDHQGHLPANHGRQNL